MAVPARFLFDTDFAAPAAQPAAKPAVVEPEVPPEPMISVAEHLAALEATRAEAQEDGFNAGRSTAEARAAERLADETGRLVGEARRILAALEEHEHVIEREAATLAVAVAKKLAATLIAREPLAEVQALVAECLGPLRRAPHLVIRLAEEDADGLKPEVDRLARETGFEGRIILIGEPEVRRGDCRIEWADGGIVRDSDALARMIDDAIGRFIATRPVPAGRVHTSPVNAGGRAREDVSHG
jgi:flagellar assembly protein FliH